VIAAGWRARQPGGPWVCGLSRDGPGSGAQRRERAGDLPPHPDKEPEAAAQATSVLLDNTLEDYRREIQRRVFG
jgi:hypothetical protein